MTETGKAEIIAAVKAHYPYMQSKAEAIADTVLRNLFASGLEITDKIPVIGATEP